MNVGIVIMGLTMFGLLVLTLMALEIGEPDGPAATGGQVPEEQVDGAALKKAA